MITAIVAAAGLSRRMGAANKMLLPFGSSTVVAHTAGRLLDAGLDVLVVAGFEAEAVQEAVRHLRVRVIVHPHYEQGLGSSLQAGLRAATGEGYMLCLADMVNITSEEYRQLTTAFRKALASDARAICLPYHKGEKGNPVIFSAAYREELLAQPPGEGFREVVQANRSHIHSAEMDSPHVLEDMDHPEDYERLRCIDPHQ